MAPRRSTPEPAPGAVRRRGLPRQASARGQRRWPAPVYYTYGPTETNVCTFARIPADIPPERHAYPSASPATTAALVLEEDGHEVAWRRGAAVYERSLGVSGYEPARGESDAVRARQAAGITPRPGRWIPPMATFTWDAATGWSSGAAIARARRRARATFTLRCVRRRSSRRRTENGACGLWPVFPVTTRNPSSSNETFCASPVYMSPDRFRRAAEHSTNRLTTRRSGSGRRLTARRTIASSASLADAKAGRPNAPAQPDRCQTHDPHWQAQAGGSRAAATRGRRRRR